MVEWHKAPGGVPYVWVTTSTTSLNTKHNTAPAQHLLSVAWHRAPLTMVTTHYGDLWWPLTMVIYGDHSLWWWGRRTGTTLSSSPPSGPARVRSPPPTAGRGWGQQWRAQRGGWPLDCIPSSCEWWRRWLRMLPRHWQNSNIFSVGNGVDWAIDSTV